MIVCPNCNHSNPEGAQTCEACYTPLSATTNCPNCGATVQVDASFCGQCGTNLKPTSTSVSNEMTTETPIVITPDPMTELERLATITEVTEPKTANPPSRIEPPAPPVIITAASATPTPPPATSPRVVSASESATPPASPPPVVISASESATPPPPPATVSSSFNTQLQQQIAKLLHVQTNTIVELPTNLSVIHIGKQNDRIPPDIDVSGFPNAEIVSRIHADIRVEGDAFYIEDVGSSNGTYINNRPLAPGDRHRLRAGDRIALGKGDLVTFLFQSN